MLDFAIGLLAGEGSSARTLQLIAYMVIALPVIYLFQLNRLLSRTPEEVRKLSPTRWTKELLQETYAKLSQKPISIATYADQLPPKLERRYIVTGGSGLVGGDIVRQLLARGQPPEAIRILDFQRPHRPDMLGGPAAEVEFIRADISNTASVDAAFSAPWPSPAVSRLPLTVFHTAAVIVPSDRSKLMYGLCESVNVRGTQHIVDAARRAGADICVSTTSGSIAIRPVEFWFAPWKLWTRWPRNLWQLLDDADFFKPLRAHEEFFGNYAASKAAAERIVCGANSPAFRTGCIRPANGVYGNPTDNPVGGPLSQGAIPEWTNNTVQSFVHCANVAVAHLQLEAVLTLPTSASSPQAGRPFTITDPNPPILYGDLYYLIKVLAVTPSRRIHLQPALLLVPAYLLEWYSLLLVKSPLLGKILPPLSGDARHLKPPIFSITTHLFATNEEASRPVEKGGIGYKGILTSLEGMTQEILEWNLEHADAAAPRKVYRSSLALADEIRKLGAVTSTVGA